MKNEIFKKYFKRLRLEGFLRALLCGCAVGFGALFICASVCWFVGFKGIWVSAVVFAVSALISTPLFYRFIFSPTTKSMARRIDELGLEERILTMTQLEGDTSYIATVQRADAMAALGKLNASMIKIAVSVANVVICAAVGLGAVSMTTVHALNVAGIVPSGLELVMGEELEKEFTLTYKINGEGAIFGVPAGEEGAIGTGLPTQEVSVKVKEGESAKTVVAIPANGYVFVGWSDRLATPIRPEAAVKASRTLTAFFQPVDGAEFDDLYDNITDPPLDLEPGDGDGNGGGGDPEPGENRPSDGDGKDGNGAGAGNKPANQVIDGKTYYGDVYNMSYEDAMNYIANNDLPENVKNSIKHYYDTIAAKGEEEQQ